MTGSRSFARQITDAIELSAALLNPTSACWMVPSASSRKNAGTVTGSYSRDTSKSPSQSTGNSRPTSAQNFRVEARSSWDTATQTSPKSANSVCNRFRYGSANAHVGQSVSKNTSNRVPLAGLLEKSHELPSNFGNVKAGAVIQTKVGTGMNSLRVCFFGPGIVYSTVR